MKTGRSSNWLVLAVFGGVLAAMTPAAPTSAGVESTQGFGIAPLLVALNLPAIHTDLLDIWAGPQVGYLLYPDNLSYSASGGRTFSYKPVSSFNPIGLVVGSDIKLSKTVYLTIDPTFVTLGFTKRF